MKRSIRFLALVATAAMGSSAFADFSGQTILGPLSPGSIVNGNNFGATDDNDGFFSGGHLFNIWDGGDDVYRLNWPGGDLTVTMTYNNLLCDPDLFLYGPPSYDDSIVDAYANTGVDSVFLAAAPAGTYYVLVDSTVGSEGAYQLEVSAVPGPGSLVLLGGGLLGMHRRRRAS